jgi:hypothetical protein
LVFAFGAFTSLLWNAFLSDAFFIAVALAVLIRIKVPSPIRLRCPAAGWYTLAVVVSGTMAANSSVMLRAQLAGRAA